MFSLRPSRSITTTPIFQCTVNYRPGMGKTTFGDCEIELMSLEPSKTGFDLSLDIIDDPAGTTQVALIARSDVYNSQQTQSLLQSFNMFVRSFASHPQHGLTQVNPYDLVEVSRTLSFGSGRCMNTDSAAKVSQI